jgi:hypothetical protein
MTAAEFNEARSILAWTDDQLAAELNVTPRVVQAWTTGRVGIPRRHAMDMWLLAVAEMRNAAPKEGEPPECEWIRNQERQPVPSGTDALIEFTKSIEKHTKVCPVCIARRNFVEERIGPMPPQSRWMGVFGMIARVPAWARPAVLGALALGAIVLARILLMLPRLLSEPGKVGEALVAVLAAAGAGAAGGAVYSATRPSLRKLGRPGDYLTGIVCVFGYMGALALAAPYAFGEHIVKDGTDWVVFSIFSAFFGLFIGHSWFRRSGAE